MASLTGTKIKDTYDSLLKVSDNGALDGTLQTITDGLGNNSTLSLSTSAASIGGTLGVTGATTLSSTLAVAGNAAFDTNTLFVDAASNRVGVGTSTAGAILTVTGDNNAHGNTNIPSVPTLLLNRGSSSSGNYAGLVINTSASGSEFGLYSNQNGALFYHGGTERMRINSSGFVGIGESTPLVPLHISRNTASGENLALILDNNDTTANAEVGLLFRAATGGQNTDFQIATINTAANQAQLVFRSDGGTERMRIDSSGNVGIGRTPNTTLDVAGTLRVSPSGVPSVQIYRDANLGNNASAGVLSFGGKDTSVFADGAGIDATTEGVWSPTSHPTRLSFSTTASASTTRTERMRITSAGFVLIGKTSTGASGTKGIEANPDGSLSIVNDFADSAGESIFLNRNSGTGLFLRLRKSNSDVGSISTDGTSTAFNTSSDYRLKEDWQPMEGALDRVDALKPVNFVWKSNGRRVDGFLAHELQEVVPEAVTGQKDATEMRPVEIAPAVYEDVIHPAEDAVYEEVIHEAVEAVYEEIQHDAIAEELDEEGNVIVEAQEAWVEQVLVSPAQEEWTEQVLISEAKEEWVEKVLVSEAVFEDQEFPVYQGIDQSKIVPLLVAAIQELRAEIQALKA